MMETVLTWIDQIRARSEYCLRHADSIKKKQKESEFSKPYPDKWAFFFFFFFLTVQHEN